MSYTQTLDQLHRRFNCGLPHGRRTLREHLLGVAGFLDSVGADPQVVLAGGAHSLYGTSAFTTRVVQERNEIREALGEDAERLVYGFHRLNRVKRWWLLPDAELYDRFDGQPLSPNYCRKDLVNLRLIELANLAEQL